MVVVLIGVVVAIAILLATRGTAKRARAKRDVRAASAAALKGLVAQATGMLLAKVGSLAQARDAAPAESTIWQIEADHLVFRANVALSRLALPQAAVEYAALLAKIHPTPVQESDVETWLEHGITRGIGNWMAASSQRALQRLTLMQREPPPSAAEIAACRAEAEAERVEMDTLLGTNNTQVPPARVV